MVYFLQKTISYKRSTGRDDWSATKRLMPTFIVFWFWLRRAEAIRLGWVPEKDFLVIRAVGDT